MQPEIVFKVFFCLFVFSNYFKMMLNVHERDSKLESVFLTTLSFLYMYFLLYCSVFVAGN